MDVDKILNEKLDRYMLDCQITESIRNPSVIFEANSSSQYKKTARSLAAIIGKSRLPKAIKKELMKNPSKTLSTAGLLTVIGIAKISGSVYKLYLKMYYKKCSTMRNQQARSECILQSKIKAKMKTIQQLSLLKNKDNKERIDDKIQSLKDQVKKMRKKSLNIGLKF